MPDKHTDKPITVKLGPTYAEALRYFKKHELRHLSITEQIRRALICYWVQQGHDGGVASGIAMPGFEPGDEEFGIVAEGDSDEA